MVFWYTEWTIYEQPKLVKWDDEFWLMSDIMGTTPNFEFREGDFPRFQSDIYVGF